jgi:DNA-binding CsgD family transcriptional regulator
MGCPDTAGDARPTGSAALIGRDPEIAQLTALLDAPPGRATVVVIEGPPGSGRTRLLTELAAVARRRGVTVLPESEWIGFVGAGWILRREQGRGAPLLFLCDHHQRIDERVWTVLDQLAESAPVLVALTARATSDLRPADHLGTPHVTRIRLAPLAPGAVRDLAATLLAAPPGPDLLDLSRIAAGRPGALRDLITGLSEEGLLRRVAGRPVLTSVRLPARTRERLSDQLAALSPPARHLLQAATTLRSPFPLVRLTRLLQVSPVLVLPAIDEVLEAGLLTGDNVMLRFSHDLLRPIVEASMPRPVVAALRDERTRLSPKRTRPLPAPPPRPQPAADWSLLTAREREVADFVGRALTNRQIATRLDRSPHTVNYHLRQIFQKLGITSRVELASLVRQRDQGGRPELPAAGQSSA